jgi:hypothetical protein
MSERRVVMFSTSQELSAFFGVSISFGMRTKR